MYRRFISTIAAVAIAITAIGAVPAHAGDRDTVRALAAIAGIAIVGKIIHDERKKKKSRREVVPTRRVQPAPIYKPRHSPRASVYPPHRTQRYNPPRYTPPRGTLTPRPLPSHVNRKLLPKQCFQNFNTRTGKVQMFDERCLTRDFQHSNSLPRACRYEFGTPHGTRRGYEARCLRDAGYRLARG